MDIIKFPVGATNIFPIANSRSGGQLLSEWNIRSRESVSTDPNVQYFIGPSYAHSASDYMLVTYLDTVNGQGLTSSQIQITGGRALVNGHFVELLEPIIIDMKEENLNRVEAGDTKLSGRLCIGLRAYYSTEQTTSGAMLIEEDGYYLGIRVVILPYSEFILPTSNESSYVDESLVTAHLKLGEINLNGDSVITSCIQNPGKIQMFSADRVGDLSSLIDNTYVTKRNLAPGHNYVYSGKGTADNLYSASTWCQADSNLMIWEKTTPSMTTDASKKSDVSSFNRITDTTKGDIGVFLNLAHKQVDGYKDQSDNPLYFPDSKLLLPSADYDAGTAGVITSSYTNKIKETAQKVDNLYSWPGMQDTVVMYIDVLEDRAILDDYIRITN